MGPIVKGGIVLGVVCIIWELVFGVMGWYKDPVLMNLFWVVILLELVVLIWYLRMTAATNSYGKQLATGTLMSVVGAVIIFGGSLLFTMVLFPNYFTEFRQLQADMLRQAGKSEEEIRSALALSAPVQTPLANALSGALGTVFAGILESLVIGIFLRKKNPATR
jgi:hypothetical protein